MTSLVLHDADHVTMAVQAQSDRSWIRAASLRYQSRQLERYLQRTCAPFNHILTLTDYDREAYRTLGIDNVHALAVPLPDLPAAAPALDGDTLVFLGSVDYLPNRHALSWFLREVFPLVTRSFPRARLRVIGGGNPAGEPSIPLCSQVDWIGRNTAEEFERQFVDVAIGIAPVWLGTGVKVKVLDMVWRGLPVVSTTVASRGTPVERGAGLIADSAESFAAAVCELLGSREHRLALQAAGRDLLRQYHVGPSSRARVRAAILGGDLNS
jgi:glycosyltransferase involved in cell wall biosynthesis